MDPVSLIDVPLAESEVLEEDVVVARRGRPRPMPMLGIKKQVSSPALPDRSGAAVDKGAHSDHSDDSPRGETGLGSHRARPHASAASREEAPVPLASSPRGRDKEGAGKFVGFMRSTQNAMKQTLKTLQQRQKPKESSLAPLEDWEAGEEPDALPSSPSAGTGWDGPPTPPNAPPPPAIPASIAVLPMMPNEKVVHAFPGLLWAHDTFNPDAMRVGVCYLTNADMGFLPEQSDVEGFRVPLQMISSVSKVGKKSGKGEFYFLTLQLHDFRSFRLAVPKTSDQRGTLHDVLMAAVFTESLQHFFAFSREKIEGGDGWNVFVAESEMLRQFQRLQNLNLEVNWRVCINSDYWLCPTYPKILGVPTSVTDELVANVASFRSRGRFPALSYLHTNGRCITRAAQPMVGIKGNRSGDDEDLVEAIRRSAAATDSMWIFDARPKVNAVANQAMGKGFESAKLYKQTLIKFLNIANIHVMRESLHKLGDAIALSQTAALSSEWTDHKRRILVSAVTIAAAIHIDNSPCLVHCLARNMQILTSEGFLTLDDLAPRWNGHSFSNGLLIGAVNGATHAIEYQLCERLVCNREIEAGAVVEFAVPYDNVFLRVTPEHDMYVENCSGWQKMNAVQVCEKLMLENVRLALLVVGECGKMKRVVFGRENVKCVRYSDVSWCVTVAHGLIVARHCSAGSAPVVLGNCSDGWDRTTQLTSLSMILLDPFYRTIVGFEILVEKEWLSFGHRFAQRTGHEPKRMANLGDQERSPVFLQFCDCVFQLTKLAPCAFEFNELLLEEMMDAVYSCHFGTFLCDSDKERDEAQLRSKTESFWSYVKKRQQSKLYSNIFYDPSADGDVVLPAITPWNMNLWSYFTRFSEKKPKERSRPVIAPRTTEDAFRILKEENERLKKLLGES